MFGTIATTVTTTAAGLTRVTPAQDHSQEVEEDSTHTTGK
ncbi:hypothetical protein SOVF_212260 [Spinacia oleracea]|nr:hypothetical protein SOVF_212260 [Spinacia oleracea]